MPNLGKHMPVPFHVPFLLLTCCSLSAVLIIFDIIRCKPLSFSLLSWTTSFFAFLPLPLVFTVAIVSASCTPDTGGEWERATLVDQEAGVINRNSNGTDKHFLSQRFAKTPSPAHDLAGNGREIYHLAGRSPTRSAALYLVPRPCSCTAGLIVGHLPLRAGSAPACQPQIPPRAAPATYRTALRPVLLSQTISPPAEPQRNGCPKSCTWTYYPLQALDWPVAAFSASLCRRVGPNRAASRPQSPILACQVRREPNSFVRPGGSSIVKRGATISVTLPPPPRPAALPGAPSGLILVPGRRFR